LVLRFFSLRLPPIYIFSCLTFRTPPTSRYLSIYGVIVLFAQVLLVPLRALLSFFPRFPRHGYLPSWGFRNGLFSTQRFLLCQTTFPPCLETLPGSPGSLSCFSWAQNDPDFPGGPFRCVALRTGQPSPFHLLVPRLPCRPSHGGTLTPDDLYSSLPKTLNFFLLQPNLRVSCPERITVLFFLFSDVPPSLPRRSYGTRLLGTVRFSEGSVHSLEVALPVLQVSSD